MSLKGFFIFIGLCIVSFLIVWVYKGKAELAQKEIEQWKMSYNQIVQVQQDKEEALLQLKKHNEDVGQELLEWKTKYDETDKQLAATAKRIRKLERENEKIRSVLLVSVPCELWLEIFPNSTKCPRKDTGGEAGNSNSSSTGN